MFGEFGVYLDPPATFLVSPKYLLFLFRTIRALLKGILLFLGGVLVSFGVSVGV